MQHALTAAALKNGCMFIYAAAKRYQAVCGTENEAVSVRQCWEKLMQRFLFHYRITPYCTTGVSPCGLFMHIRIKSSFVANKKEEFRRVHCFGTVIIIIRRI